MKFYRTPDSCFTDLKDYPFTPHYTDVHSLRMHYVDEGPEAADPVLMLHGEPSWSYLYRHMIPVCAAAGHRVIAPDLIGFGRSDKPRRLGDYSYKNHVDWIAGFIQSLDLNNITLVCQDWGSLIGLRVAAENEARFARIVVGNGALPTGKGRNRLPLAFTLWKTFARWSPWFPIDRIMMIGTSRSLDADERRAYRAPFPATKYKVATRAFPRLVPVSTKDPAHRANEAAWERLCRWNKPFLTAFSDGDPIFKGKDKYLQRHIPGARSQKHVTLKGGHFLQEDSGVEFANVINDFIAATSMNSSNA